MRFDWPYLDLTDPSRDVLFTVADANYNPQLFLLGALDPTPATDPTDDLRNIRRNIASTGGWWHPVTNDRLYTRVLGPETFDTLIRARKREFWVRMLSGDSMGVNELNQANYVPADEVWGFWHDEGLGTLNPLNHRTLNQFVVADGIVARAVILDANGNDLRYPAGTGVALDALDAHVKFSYSDGRNDNVYYFNALENLADPDQPDGSVDSSLPADGVVDYVIPNIPTLLRAGGVSRENVLEADNRLADNQLAADRVTRANLGSPLLPRLPAVVTPDLWVTRSKTRPGSPGFRRRFVQSLQVPTAGGREPSRVIAQSPGQAF